MYSRMEQGNKDRKVVSTSVISVNAVASVLMLLSMIYLYMQVLYQQDEINDVRSQLQTIVEMQPKSASIVKVLNVIIVFDV